MKAEGKEGLKIQNEEDLAWIEWTPEKMIKLSDFKIAQQMHMIAALMKEQGFINDESYQRYIDVKENFITSAVVDREKVKELEKERETSE